MDNKRRNAVEDQVALLDVESQPTKPLELEKAEERNPDASVGATPGSATANAGAAGTNGRMKKVGAAIGATLLVGGIITMSKMGVR